MKFQISDLLSEPFPDTGPNPFKTDTFERRAKARQNITDEWGRASPGFLAMLIWFYQSDLMQKFHGTIGADFTILNIVERSHLQTLAELVEAELEIGVHNFFDNIPVEDWEQYHNRTDHATTAPALYTADTSDYTPDKLVWTPANAEQWTKAKTVWFEAARRNRYPDKATITLNDTPRVGHTLRATLSDSDVTDLLFCFELRDTTGTVIADNPSERDALTATLNPYFPSLNRATAPFSANWERA